MAGCPLCEKIRNPPRAEVVAEFTHSIAFLGPWQFYRGYCILVARSHATELFHLDLTERHAFLEEMNRLAAAIARVVQPRKMNCELLGNQVPHLHWHLFPRFQADADHLKPVWVALDRVDTDPAEKERLTGPKALRAETLVRLREELQA